MHAMSEILFRPLCAEAMRAAFETAHSDPSADPRAARAAIIPPAKAALGAARDRIRAAFEGNDPDGLQLDGRGCVRAAAAAMDAVVAGIACYADRRVYRAANPTAGERFAVMACGGYGRGELAPASDVDLLFLTDVLAAPRVEQIVEFTLYTLWDLKLKVGHATRSTGECVRRARGDATIMTTLLETRPVYGDDDLIAEFKRRYFDEAVRGNEAGFIAAKLAERSARHERHGASRYMLEPNVKEGKGGLRDLQTLFWLARAAYAVETPDSLVAKGVLTRAELRRFNTAHEFLTALRCSMHYAAGREDDRLTFDLQTDVGRRMGFADRAGAVAVERLLKRYFLAAKDVGDLTRVFCAAMEDAYPVDTRSLVGRVAAVFARDKPVDGFTAARGRLMETAPDQFAAKPIEMLRIFRVAQRRGLDVHPNALRRIRGLLPKISALRADPEANALFLEIVAAREDPEATLRRMNEAGLLGRFVPEFGRIVAMAQFNMYHVYTADEHALFAVGNLHRIEMGLRGDDLPLSTDVMQKIASRRALYVATFLHDVMKGRAGDHSILGEKAARKLCPRFGLTAEETDTVAWLIRWHLYMSDTAFKRDVDDPRAVEEFAARVASPERLRLLLLLTVADIRAVGPQTWTVWKAQLLRRLYWNAEAALSEGFTHGEVERRVARAKAAAAPMMAHLPEVVQQTALNGGTNAYWLSFSNETYARHAALVAEAATEDDPLIIDTRVDAERGVTDVTVIAKDRPGLLPAITGGLAGGGADIVAARLFTMENRVALDVFSVQSAEPGPGAGELERRAGALREARSKPGPIERPDQRARLAATVRRAVEDDADPGEALAGRRRATLSRARVFGVAPRVLFDLDGSPHFTIVEVNGRDRPGFLHLVSKALTAQDVQVGSAKITTFGEHAVDVFYIKDRYGHKVTQAARLKAIREAIEGAIRADDEAMGFPAESSSAERRAAA